MPDGVPSVLIAIVTVFLIVCLILYVIFGGADFGAGMLAAFVRGESSARERELLHQAIAPVWEANHIWIIIALVILFNAFPRAFAEISTTFHIPLTALLVGITLRGSAYALRHYDEVQDRAHAIYERVFVAGSFVAPFALGLVAGGLLLGRTDPGTLEFWPRFVAPWANRFSVSVGVFLCTIAVFLAAVFSGGEADRDSRRRFVTLATRANIAAVAVGLAVFVAAGMEGLPLATGMLTRPLALGSVLGTLPLVAALHLSMRRNFWGMARLFASSIVALILLGWFSIQYPSILIVAPGSEPLTLTSSAAPPAVLRVLALALVGGLALVLPALGLLLAIFKRRG